MVPQNLFLKSSQRLMPAQHLSSGLTRGSLLWAYQRYGRNWKYVTVFKLHQFAMPNTCENCLGLAKCTMPWPDRPVKILQPWLSRRQSRRLLLSTNPIRVRGGPGRHVRLKIYLPLGPVNIFLIFNTENKLYTWTEHTFFEFLFLYVSYLQITACTNYFNCYISDSHWIKKSATEICNQ